MKNEGRDQTPSGETGISPPEESAAALFGLLWESLADVLGTATTATLISRSIRYASARRASLGAISVTRDGFEYRFSLPADWSQDAPEAVDALRDLIAELCRLLVPLTGSIVVRRLQNVAEFGRRGLVSPQGSS